MIAPSREPEVVLQRVPPCLHAQPQIPLAKRRERAADSQRISGEHTDDRHRAHFWCEQLNFPFLAQHFVFRPSRASSSASGRGRRLLEGYLSHAQPAFSQQSNRFALELRRVWFAFVAFALNSHHSPAAQFLFFKSPLYEGEFHEQKWLVLAPQREKKHQVCDRFSNLNE